MKLVYIAAKVGKINIAIKKKKRQINDHDKQNDVITPSSSTLDMKLTTLKSHRDQLLTSVTITYSYYYKQSINIFKFKFI